MSELFLYTCVKSSVEPTITAKKKYTYLPQIKVQLIFTEISRIAFIIYKIFSIRIYRVIRMKYNNVYVSE